MDSRKTHSSQDDANRYDADVTTLVYQSGKSIKKLLTAIRRGLESMITSFLLLLLFLTRNIVWILLFTGLGIAYGIYQLTRTGPQFSSEMTVKANFNSSRTLYAGVDYLNSLISAGDTKTLGSLFGVTAAEAAQVKNFSVDPVKSEIITAELYKEQFMHYDRSSKVRLDTFWTKTITYKDYKEKLTDFEYPYHTITAKSTNAAIFRRLENGLLTYVSNNELLQQIRKRQVQSNHDEEELLVSAIKNIDSLRMSYNRRLQSTQPSAASGSNQVTIMDRPNGEYSPPELALYDKMLELQDVLKNSRKRTAIEHDIVEVYSPFSPVGKKESIYTNIIWSGLYGLIAGILALILIAAYKGLLKFDKARKKKLIHIAAEQDQATT